MKRILPFLAASAVSLVLAAAAFAQSADPAAGKADKGAVAQPASPSPATTPAPDASSAPAATSTPATAPATEAAAPATNPAIERVKERGMKTSDKERADVEKKLDDLEKGIETESTTKGEAAVAGRIGAEFGVTADALTAEKSQYGRGYGELLVAHTLMANAGKTDVTMADVFTMRSQGMGWGAIASGLDLKLGDVVSAVKSEQRVALGLEKGDGKAATIHLASAAGSTKAAKAPKASKGEVKASAAGAGAGGGVDLNKATGK